MSGLCPNHGPYDGSVCPYPPPHGDNAISVEKKQASDESVTELPSTRRRILDLDDLDEDVTGLPQSDYDDFLDSTELASPDTVALALLWVKEGKRRGRTYPIRSGTIIGRKTADIILDDHKVSSMHAKFKKDGDDFILWDLGSSNGTSVNGKRVHKATVLYENDLIKIGDTVFIAKFLEPRKRKPTNASAIKKRAVRKTKPIRKTK